MPPLPGDKLLLEGWCSLQCSRIIEQPDYNPVEEFSFLSAVEEGYFSDMVIESQENKSVCKLYSS